MTKVNGCFILIITLLLWLWRKLFLWVNKMIKKLFSQLDKITPEFIRIWEDVANIESPTSYKQGVDAAENYFADYARKKGWKVEEKDNEFSGKVVCITMNEDSEEQPIILSGHLDTVHPVGSFGTPAVKIEGNKMLGPGVMDCKGGAVASLMAMTALNDIGFKKRPIRLLLQSDEEVNSMQSNKQTINYMIEKSKGAIAFLNCESYKNDALVLWRKGIIRYQIDIKGRSIHASRCAEGGASAIIEAAHKILEFEKYKDGDGITSVCGIINGGTSPNTVPDSCSFVVEYRYVTDAHYKEIEDFTKAVSEKVYVEGTETKYRMIGHRHAMEKCRRNFDLLDKINGIFKEAGLKTVGARGSLGGSDAADVTHAGIPCIDSIGVSGDFIHTPREFAYIDSLNESAKRIASIACLI